MNHRLIFKPSVVLSGIGLLLACTTVKATDPATIVVSASLVEKSRSASGSAITVIDASYLEQNQIRTVADALRDVPGLAVSQSGGPGSKTQVRIRGAEANQTLVLIDGIEVNDIAGGSEFDFADLVNLQIERVEVLRGAQSALWGSDAMGGVINIITKKGKGPLNAQLTMEGGSFDSQRQAFNLNGGAQTYHYSLSASRFKTDGISSLNENRGYPEKDGYKNSTVSFKGGWQATNKLSFDMVLRHLESNVDTDGFIFAVGAVDDDSHTEKRQQYGKIAAHLALFDDQWQQSVSLSGNDTDNEYFSTSKSFSQGEKQKLAYQSDVFASQGKLDHRASIIIEQEEESFESTYFSTKRSTDHTSAAFEYGLDFDNRYHATIAGRQDNNDIFDDAQTYRFTLAGWLSNTVRAHASKGSGVKNPSFFELFGSTPTYTGNANLRPEQNTTWDIGSEYHFKSLNGYVDLTYFHSDVDSLISGSGNTSVNLPNSSTIKGWELSAIFKPSPNVRLNASYTYTDTDDGTGNELVRRARHIASLNSSYLFANGKTRLSGGVQYNGKQDDLEFDAFYNSTPVTLAAYTLVNVALSHQLSKRIELFARVDNVFDEDYEEVFSYGTKGVAGTIGITLRGGL